MCKSIIEQVCSDIQTQYENDMVNVVQSYGFNVDKEELEKALAYDRGQYEKGFADGVMESIQHGHWITHNDGDPFLIYGSCSKCGFEQSISSTLHYCPDCGAKMDEEVE